MAHPPTSHQVTSSYTQNLPTLYQLVELGINPFLDINVIWGIDIRNIKSTGDSVGKTSKTKAL